MERWLYWLCFMAPSWLIARLLMILIREPIERPWPKLPNLS